MKGFATLGPKQVGWIEKDKPAISAVDALLKPLAVAPCTSDIHTVWERPVGFGEPRILGHEVVGEVVEVGSLVKDFKPGDKVIVPAVTPYWEKIESQMGFHQHCGGMLQGIQFTSVIDGVFSEYFRVIEADGNLAFLPEGVTPEEGVMLTDMVPTGFHGVENAEVGFGETVLVIGVGPVGLMAVAGANLRGAARILAVGSRQICLDAAKFYGATDTVSYRDGDVVDQVKALVGGKVDKVIIAGGDLTAFEWALKVIRPAGIISNVNYFGSGEFFKVNRLDWGLGMGHIRIIGGLTPGGRKTIQYLANLLKWKKLDVKPLITHRLQGWEGVEQGLQLMKDKPRDMIKPVVTL
jgi:threonine dehydrogenase-like Zn-dependent dehydrogenase